MVQTHNLTNKCNEGAAGCLVTGHMQQVSCKLLLQDEGKRSILNLEDLVTINPRIAQFTD